MIRSTVRLPVTGWMLAAVLVLLPCTQNAQAGFVLQLNPVSTTVTAGQSFDVTVQLVTDASGGGDLSGFSAAVFVENPLTGLAITGATQPNMNYVFEGNSSGFLFNLLSPLGDPSTTRIVVVDIPDSPAFVTVGANQTFDLAVISFTTTNATSGTTAIRFDQDFSRLDNNSTGDIFPVNFVDSQLTVTNAGVSAVPVPSSFILGALGTILLTAGRRCLKPRVIA